VLAVASGGAQIVFGGLALAWPDLTLLIAAVLFGDAHDRFTERRSSGGRVAARRKAARLRRVRRHAARVDCSLDAAGYALAVGLGRARRIRAGGSTAGWPTDHRSSTAFYDAPDDAPDEQVC
jgi:hypothetical protein